MSETTLPKKSVLSFLQSATNSFWKIESAIEQNELAHAELLKARTDISTMVRCLHQAFPETTKLIELIQPGPELLEIDKVS